MKIIPSPVISFLLLYISIQVEGLTYPPKAPGVRIIGRSWPRKVESSPRSLSNPQTEGFRLTPVPVLDGPTGRWFFDWFWGPDPGSYPPPSYPPSYPPPLPPIGPPLPPIGPPIPQPPPYLPGRPDVLGPLEYCTQITDPLTGDVIEDCYPINR